jgi:hypothetical protein
MSTNDSKTTLEQKLGAGVSRRGVLRGAAIAAGGVIAAGTLAVEPAAAGKMSQAAAGYQATPKDGNQCSNCALFEVPSSCKIVDGSIAPTGWCRFFAKKS